MALPQMQLSSPNRFVLVALPYGKQVYDLSIMEHSGTSNVEGNINSALLPTKLKRNADY